MTMAEVIAFVVRLRRRRPAPRCARRRPSPLSPASARATTSPPIAGISGAAAWCWRAARAISPACRHVRQAVPASVECFTALEYRNPAQLPDGGVLVVGASATGVQLADEIRRSGRPVTLSVGEHVRLPRTYRGRDVLWWMEASGIWNQRYDEIDDLTRARKLPSPQLVGTPERATLDLNSLSDAGVQIVGRLAAVRDGRALFSGGLRNQFALADLKMDRLLDAFDEWARSHARDADVGPSERFEATRPPASSRLDLPLATGEIKSIIWATGFRPDYSWLAGACCGSEGASAPRWRRRRCAGAVRDWAARSPAPQVHLHPRRGGRRAGSDRASRRLSGEAVSRRRPPSGRRQA